MPNPTATVAGAHLVGSVNLDTAETVFRAAAWNCGSELHSLPDGETGERFHWILFQGARFDLTPGISRLGPQPIELAGFDVRPFGIDEGVDPATIEFPALGYAEAAKHSYAIFKALKAESGVIPEHVRFQVSLPTPVATVTTFVRPEDRAALEGPYERAVLRELAEITAAIPHDQLTIQWDMALEFALLEEVTLPGFGPMRTWFDDPFEGLVSRAAHLGDEVPADVNVGYHLCYGDVAEKHFMEPKDATNLTRVANALFERVKRHVDFVHMPVPIERDDTAYFAPLKDLHLPEGTKLYLGLLHREDGVEGAKRRIKAAASAVPAFGVATECGMGRSPRESIEPLLKLHSQAVKAAQEL
jgi:methionine synthase II (cobalamin-independent)